MIGAVDIGGTKIAVGVVDEEGRVLAKAECLTDVPRGFVDAMQRVAEMLAQCVDRTRINLQGIGIGCTGPVDPVSGALGTVNLLPGWEGGNLVEALSAKFSVPAAMENDADAAGLGEAVWGAGKGKVRLVYVTISTGIGASVILEGKVYRGSGGCHPEIGHHVVEPSGPACSCGARGCWESLASGPAMAEWSQANAPAGFSRNQLSAKLICARAAEGDEWARCAVEREGYYLGVGLANIVSVFTPDAIVLGGGVMKSANLFLDRIRQVIRENCRLVPHDRVEISLASLGPDVALIGAAQVWHHRFAR
ncbi:MAG: ROK family protein [Terriglobia bacterium]|jgi:glucokinase